MESIKTNELESERLKIEIKHLKEKIKSLESKNNIINTDLNYYKNKEKNSLEHSENRKYKIEHLKNNNLTSFVENVDDLTKSFEQDAYNYFQTKNWHLPVINLNSHSSIRKKENYETEI